MTRHTSRIGKLPAFHKYSAYTVLILCAITGIAYLVGQELNFFHNWLANRNVLIAHGISAFAILIVIGSVLPNHVKVSWRAGKNRVTGMLMGGLVLILTTSALFLYYGSEESRDTALWGHWVAGISVFIIFPLHVLVGGWSIKNGKKFTPNKKTLKKSAF